MVSVATNQLQGHIYTNLWSVETGICVWSMMKRSRVSMHVQYLIKLCNRSMH